MGETASKIKAEAPEAVPEPRVIIRRVRGEIIDFSRQIQRRVPESKEVCEALRSLISDESRPLQTYQNEYLPLKLDQDRLPLLTCAQTGYHLLEVQKLDSKSMNIRRKASSINLGVLSGLGNAAPQLAAAASAAKLSGLYRVVINDPTLAKQFAGGLIELVPTNATGLLSSQLREIGGKAVGTANLVSAGPGLAAVPRALLSIGAVFSIVGSFAVEARFARIESALERIHDRIEAQTQVDIIARMNSCLKRCVDFRDRIRAGVHAGLEERISLLQKDAPEVFEEVRGWIEHELNELELVDYISDTKVPLRKIQQFWLALLQSHRLVLFSIILELEHARALRDTERLSFLQAKFAAKGKEMKEEALELLNCARSALLRASENSKDTKFKAVTNWVHSGNDQFSEILKYFDQWEALQRDILDRCLPSESHFFHGTGADVDDDSGLWVEIIPEEENVQVKKMLSDQPHNNAAEQQLKFNFFSAVHPEEAFELKD